jgi:TldD protein
MRDACAAAVDAALGAGASYADARAIVRRTQAVGTRDGRVVTLNDAETQGIGVRVLVAGAWGFACDRRLEAAGAKDAALRATAFAAAAGRNGNRALAPLEARSGTRSRSACARRRRCASQR